MKVSNPIQMNDWEISKFLRFIMVLQVSILTLLVLDTLGVHIPILREFVAFFYLLLVPGMLLLRIMRLHKLGNIETLLYTIGLSVATLMFVGAFMDLVYPLFGISKPISLVPLITTLTLIVGLFTVLSYIRDKSFADADTIEIKHFSFILIFLCLLPFLAVFGTYLMNFYNLNIVLIFLILIICLLIILVAFNKIPKKYYPFTVFVVSLSLLFHVSLISTYITGWDIQQEYYFAGLVIKSSYWNFKIFALCNAMLSVTIIPPMLSIISGANLVWVFKIIYPLIFSLVPVGLYEIFKKQTNNKIAFLSCLLFVSFFVFYNEMLGLARQQIAELFLVLSIMLILSQMARPKKQILFVLFVFSIILSHYSIGILYISALMGVLILSYLSRRTIFSKLAVKFPRSISNFMIGFLEFMKVKDNIITPKLVLLFVFVAGFAYYALASSCTALTILYVIKRILIGLINGTSSSQGLNLLLTKQAPLHQIGKYVYIGSQIFMVLGFLEIFSSSKSFKEFHFNKNYMILTILSFLTLVACILIPFFASALNTSRFYHIALIFLAPISVIGGITFFKFIISKFRLSSEKINKKSIQLVSLFIVVFLLFNSGLVYALADDNSQSITLNSTYDTTIYNQMEVSGSIWLKNFEDPVDGTMMVDKFRAPLLVSSGFSPTDVMSSSTYVNCSDINDLKNNLKEKYSKTYRFAYFFFGTKNINDNSVLIPHGNGDNVTILDYMNLNNFFIDENEIYDNKGSKIYFWNFK